jgi:hypothetical protein
MSPLPFCAKKPPSAGSDEALPRGHTAVTPVRTVAADLDTADIGHGVQPSGVAFEGHVESDRELQGFTAPLSVHRLE